MDRSKQAVKGPGSEPARGTNGAGGDPLVARALRSAYEEAVKEDVPAEFLDLLKKLS